MHSVTQMLTELVIYQLFNVCQYANAFVNYLARLNSQMPYYLVKKCILKITIMV